MKQIANIVSELDLSNHPFRAWINYVKYVPSMKGKLMLECNLAVPTLVIGWSVFKTEFHYLAPNILKKDGYVGMPHLSWEFSMEERINDHFNGVQNFIKTAPRKFVEIKPYRTIDPIKDNILNEEHLILFANGFLNLFHCNAYQYKDEIIYLYDRTRFEITGIYLNSYRYFGYDVEKIKEAILSRVQQNSNNTVTKDVNGSIYQSYYKEFPEFDQLKRTMVLFLA